MKTSRRWAGLALFVAAILIAGSFVRAEQKDQAPAQKISGSAILIEPVHSDEVKIPAEFQMAVYEHLIKELQKSGKFKNVYRDGDQGAANTPELITLRTNVTGFKHGSEEKRQVTTVSGSTSITIHCSFVDKSGNVKLERDITGKVRFLGGNLRATYDFAKKVAQVVEQSF